MIRGINFNKIFHYLKKPLKNRKISSFILLLILLLICLNFKFNYFENQTYPSIDIIMLNYPEGDIVYVSGTVTETFKDGFFINENYRGTPVKFRIISETRVTEGDQVIILGTLNPNYQINNSKIFKIENNNNAFLLITSFIALLIVLIFFRKYWKFDSKKWEFIRRK